MYWTNICSTQKYFYEFVNFKCVNVMSGKPVKSWSDRSLPTLNTCPDSVLCSQAAFSEDALLASAKGLGWHRFLLSRLPGPSKAWSRVSAAVPVGMPVLPLLLLCGLAHAGPAALEIVQVLPNTSTVNSLLSNR